jgi:WD40 repeat protein
MIKVWDIASGTLKLTLTGHISTVRGVAVSDRHPYLFSCGEDKMVKCWDLEQNKVWWYGLLCGRLSGIIMGICRGFTPWRYTQRWIYWSRRVETRPQESGICGRGVKSCH